MERSGSVKTPGLCVTCGKPLREVDGFYLCAPSFNLQAHPTRVRSW
jgi:hypothetical protein